MKLKPLDIIAVNSLWYMPHHYPIRQRGAGSKAVHNAIVLSEQGVIENVDFIRGPHIEHIDHFKGRTVSIHRFKEALEEERLLNWLQQTRELSHGYDFRQLVAAYFGISSKSFENDETAWTCSERSYWLWQQNRIKITERDDTQPHPRWVQYNDHFECVYQGVWNGIQSIRHEG